MKYQLIRQRKKQRVRIARTIKDIKLINDGDNKKSAIACLLKIAENYPKLKDKRS